MKVFLLIKIRIHTKVILKMTKNTDMVIFNGQMVILIRAISSMISEMERER